MAAAPLTASRAAGQVRVPEPPGKKLGWALVGLGSLSINQIMPAFAKCEKSKLMAFVSGHRDKADKLAARYGVEAANIYNYENFDSIKNNPAIDIVYIVLPNGMHAEYTVRALQAGKHVLCEKPMANTPAECEQMISAATTAARKLMIGYRLRYEPFNNALIKVARDQEFGRTRVILADAGFPIGDPTQWRLNKKMAGGGSMMDIGIYALNASRYLTGEEPVELNAMMDTTPNDPRFREVEENILFQLRFPSGVIANCTSSYGAPFNRFRVVGTNGWAELEPALSYNGLRMRAGEGGKVEERLHPVIDHFAAEMDHLSDCVMTDKPPLTPGEEGLKDMRIISAVYQAAAGGGAVKL
jgi:predicted dehydrogenase